MVVCAILGVSTSRERTGLPLTCFLQEVRETNPVAVTKDVSAVESTDCLWNKMDPALKLP